MLPKARELLGLVRTVVFAPDDLALVKGDPGERRRFLDDLLVQRQPRYAGTRADYDRVLRQRNSLLKTAGASVRAGRGDVRTLEVWDAHLATTGAELLAARLRLVAALAPLAEKAYDQVSAGGGPATRPPATPPSTRRPSASARSAARTRRRRPRRRGGAAPARASSCSSGLRASMSVASAGMGEGHDSRRVPAQALSGRVVHF